MSKEDNQRFFRSFLFPFIFVCLMWASKGIEVLFSVNFSEFGINPRVLEGARGVLFSPFIHSDFNHLINNSVPILLLGTGIIYFYRKIAFSVWIWIWIMNGLWVWVAARSSYHIGASGLIYGFASFIFFSGVFSKHPKLLAMSLLVVFLYGGMVWGIFPIDYKMSWESHLFGAFAGLFIAVYYRKTSPVRKQYSWDLEDEEDDENFEALPESQMPVPENEKDVIRYIYKSNDEEKGEEK